MALNGLRVRKLNANCDFTVIILVTQVFCCYSDLTNPFSYSYCVLLFNCMLQNFTTQPIILEILNKILRNILNKYDKPMHENAVSEDQTRSD